MRPSHIRRAAGVATSVAAVLAYAVGADASGSRTSQPAFGGCSAAAPAIRPDVIITGCGDGGQYFADISWSSWTASSAAGKGTEFVNLCKPNCAAGRFLRNAVSLRLARVRVCSNRRLEFTRLVARELETGKVMTLESPWASLDSVTCP